MVLSAPCAMGGLTWAGCGHVHSLTGIRPLTGQYSSLSLWEVALADGVGSLRTQIGHCQSERKANHW